MSALRNIREKKGFNISQLASRSGISGKTLLEYEEGRQIIPLAHAKLLAKALWVQIEDLMPPPGSVAVSTPASTATPAPPTVRPTPVPAQQSPAQPTPPVQSSVTRQVAPATQSIPAQPAPVMRQPESRSQPPASNAHNPKPETKAPKSKIVPPISEGQTQELLNLAHRLNITQEQLEERVGKPLGTLNRPDATDWVKRLRAIADEIAPTQKVKYGRWPDANEDREASYLAKQRDAGATCIFHLFNEEEFSGTISDFTPYTITIKVADKDEEIVLRKLAIAYYRCMPVSAAGTNGTAPSQEVSSHNHARDDHHQPIERGIDSDRTGQPTSPEKDQMDEDRGM
ncbi:MAG TPA: helix-turn-helix domain-containing protein [Chloroflexia bacterium]|nr:helix-turn-helix domain-containing protein [Chloroflexia bacterium]